MELFFFIFLYSFVWLFINFLVCLLLCSLYVLVVLIGLLFDIYLQVSEGGTRGFLHNVLLPLISRLFEYVFYLYIFFKKTIDFKVSLVYNGYSSIRKRLIKDNQAISLTVQHLSNRQYNNHSLTIRPKRLSKKQCH